MLLPIKRLKNIPASEISSKGRREGEDKIRKAEGWIKGA
jgi:hypothetical protein